MHDQGLRSFSSILLEYVALYVIKFMFFLVRIMLFMEFKRILIIGNVMQQCNVVMFQVAKQVVLTMSRHYGKQHITWDFMCHLG
jgi:hypothetical protein